ncbi:hypothetical protein ACQVP2_10210 [Methylobacterium aquaticum]|uniref:hypothetical protein n=1 Tax=Methylobacterium aquaticum TaxID=270351 RepID=UPI003D1837C5
MRAGLTAGLVALGILAAAAPAEARGGRGGFLAAMVASRAVAAAGRTGTVHTDKAHTGKAEDLRLRVAAADAGGPEPMVTGTTGRAAPATAGQAVPGPGEVAPVKARPRCPGRLFGSGAGFCEIN